MRWCLRFTDYKYGNVPQLNRELTHLQRPHLTAIMTMNIYRSLIRPQAKFVKYIHPHRQFIQNMCQHRPFIQYTPPRTTYQRLLSTDSHSTPKPMPESPNAAKGNLSMKMLVCNWFHYYLIPLMNAIIVGPLGWQWSWSHEAGKCFFPLYNLSCLQIAYFSYRNITTQRYPGLTL